MHSLHLINLSIFYISIKMSAPIINSSIPSNQFINSSIKYHFLQSGIHLLIPRYFRSISIDINININIISLSLAAIHQAKHQFIKLSIIWSISVFITSFSVQFFSHSPKFVYIRVLSALGTIPASLWITWNSAWW